MKTSVITFGLLLYAIIGYSQLSLDKIIWQSEYKLTWDDFKGEPANSSQKTAITTQAVTFQIESKSNKAEIIIKGVFYPNRSWKKNIPSLHLLQHEQLHFDIAELFARRCRMQISKINSNNYSEIKDQSEQIFKNILNEKDKEQARYDKETDHSKNRDVQERWNTDIANRLKELEAYSDTLLILPIVQPNNNNTLENFGIDSDLLEQIKKIEKDSL